MNLMLNLSSTDLDDEDLQQLTQELCNSIASETEIKAEIPSGAVQQGDKGDIVTIGTIALAFLTTGGLTALCEVLRAYFSREPSLEINIEKDGKKVSINAKNLKPEALQALLSQADFTTR
jgi:hypothetical protein